MWFLYRAVRLGGGDAVVWLPVFVLTAGMLGRWYSFRPQLFTYLFFAYFLFILFSHLVGRRAWLWTLPIVIAVWANMHGGFLAGLGAIGLVLGLRFVQAWCRAGLQRQALLSAVTPLGVTLLACLIASLLNPFGLDLWRYVLTELTHNTNRLYNDEWMPLLRFDPHAWTIVTVFLLLGVLLLTALFAQLARKRIVDIPPWVLLLSCLPLVWMTFGSIRHVPILTMWCAPVLALLAGSAAEYWKEAPAWRQSWLATTGLIAVSAILSVWYTLSNPTPRITIAADKFPCGAVDFMRVNHLHGNVYVALHWGSYVTWELYPDVLVSMDGRNVTLFPSKMVRENFTYYLYDTKDTWVPRQYNSDYLLLPVTAPVLNQLRHDLAWHKLYEDEVAILFVFYSGHEDLVERHLERKLVVPNTVCPDSFK
jgi:hypothetical protein